MRYTMTVAEAARVLGKTERSIRKYIKDGQLTSQKLSRTPLLDPEEVQEFLKEGALPRVSHTEIRQIRAQVRRLESQMSVVMRVLDMQNETLGMTAEYAKGLLDAAHKQLERAAADTALADFENWSMIFGRMDETDLETFCRANNSDSWKILLRLSSRMVSDVVARDDYKTSLEAQQTHRILADSRRRFRISCFIYLEARGVLPPELRDGHTILDGIRDRIKNT